MFYKPCPISRSKIMLSNPHLLVITSSRIKRIGHFSFSHQFAIYTCHESSCFFLERDCHLREKDHHREHWCNYIPVLTTTEGWYTRAYCHGPSKCLLLNMNSVNKEQQTRIKLNYNKYLVYQLKLSITCFYSVYFLASSCCTATSAWFCCCCCCIIVICIWLSC